MKFLAYCLFFLCLSQAYADLKVEDFSGLPYIKRDFEQLYLGKGAVIKNQDLVFSNQGKLVLSNDLWNLTLGMDSKVKWQRMGKVFHLTIMQGSAVLKKVSDRKVYLQLNTPSSSSTGEVADLFVHVNEMTTKVWMNQGELDFKLNSVTLKEKVGTGQLLEYRSGDTMIHKINVSDDLLQKIEKDILARNPKLSVSHSAVDIDRVKSMAQSNLRRKENRTYYRHQRAELVQSIQEAVLEDGAFIFSIPVSPPPK